MDAFFNLKASHFNYKRKNGVAATEKLAVKTIILIRKRNSHV